MWSVYKAVFTKKNWCVLNSSSCPSWDRVHSHLSVFIHYIRYLYRLGDLITYLKPLVVWLQWLWNWFVSSESNCMVKYCISFVSLFRDVARIFQRGGHTVSKWGYSPDCHYGQGIVMAFLPPVVGCLVKKGLQKGGGVTGTPGPPWLRPCVISIFVCWVSFLLQNNRWTYSRLKNSQTNAQRDTGRYNLFSLFSAGKSFYWKWNAVSFTIR